MVEMNTVIYTTDEQGLSKCMKKSTKSKKLAIMTVTYHSFEKFVNVITTETIAVDRLIYDEAPVTTPEANIATQI